MAADPAPPDLDEYAELDPALLERAGWTPEELYWEELSAAGLALAESAAANDYWREAAKVAPEIFEEGDPRLATSLANLALAAGKQDGTLLRQALDCWRGSESWVEGLRPERRARSSLFHLRLQSKHRGGYDHWSRDRYRALYAEGLERLEARAQGRLVEGDAYALWRQRRPAAFEDARRLIGAVLLIAPKCTSSGPAP